MRGKRYGSFRKSIDQILKMCQEAYEAGEPLPVDIRFLSALVRYEAKRIGLPHALAKFAVGHCVRDCNEADIIIDSINDLTFEEPDSPRRRSAAWFLFKDEKMFPRMCEAAGINGELLRKQLKKMERPLTRAGRQPSDNGRA